MKILESVSLKEYSGIGIGGMANRLYLPEKSQELLDLLLAEPAPVVFGGGSNVFFADKIFPVAICTKQLKNIIQREDGCWVADCGALLSDLFDFALGVPATVGGGLLMNFGAFGFDVQQFLVSVNVFDLSLGKVMEIPKEELQFGYRYSSLSKRKWIIVSACFSAKQQLNRQQFLQKRKLSMPYDAPNIGSIFRNPPHDSAGRIIESLGLKGYAIGGAMVSCKHANVIINTGGATAQDLISLINYLQAKVRDSLGVDLKPEVICVT